LQRHTAGKPNISDSCVCVYCTRTATLLSRKEAYESFFVGFFMQTATKHEQQPQHIDGKIIPLIYTSYTPEESAFSDLIFLVFCQLYQT